MNEIDLLKYTQRRRKLSKLGDDTEGIDESLYEKLHTLQGPRQHSFNGFGRSPNPSILREELSNPSIFEEIQYKIIF